MEPASAAAWLQLAEVLKNDLVGRPVERGMDRDGAVEAYKKALELQPNNSETHANLAILLEYNNAGIRYGSGARLEEAIVEYEKILDKLAALNIPQNYPIVLLRAGNAQKLKDYVRKQKDSEVNQTLAVCAEALLNGSKAALDRAGKVSGVAAKQKILGSATQMLISIRRYNLAADLLEAGANGSGNPAGVAAALKMLRSAKPAQDPRESASTPEDALWLLLTRMMDLEHHQNDWQASLSSLVKDDPQYGLKEAKRGYNNGLTQASIQGLTPEVAFDLAAAAMQFTREGDDEKGFVVRMNGPGQGGANQRAQTFFVIKEDSRYKIVGSADTPGSIARLAWKLLDEGKPELAAVWLDRVRREIPSGSGEDPLSGPVFNKLWQTASTTTRDAASIRLGAAVLAADSTNSAKTPALAILEEAATREKATNRAMIVALALVEAYLDAKEYRKASPLVEELLKQSPQSPTALGLAMRVAYSTGGQKEGRRVLDANIARFDQDSGALRLAAVVAMRSGDPEMSAKVTRQIIDSGRAVPSDYNQLAWADLMAGNAGTASVDAVNQGLVMLGNKGNSPLLHTLAAIEAEVGKESEARAVLLQRIKADESPEPNDDDWYVFGRIAESLAGLTKDAIAMYQRLERPATDFGLPASSYALAQQRLAKQNAKP